MRTTFRILMANSLFQIKIRSFFISNLNVIMIYIRRFIYNFEITINGINQLINLINNQMITFEFIKKILIDFFPNLPVIIGPISPLSDAYYFHI